MIRYFTELGYCFEPRVTEYALESNTCLARDDASEGILLAAWDDGTNWLDLDENTLVGWVELDDVTLYPPLESYPL